MATSDAMLLCLIDWCDIEDGVEIANKQAILCICDKTNGYRPSRSNGLKCR